MFLSLIKQRRGTAGAALASSIFLALAATSLAWLMKLAVQYALALDLKPFALCALAIIFSQAGLFSAVRRWRDLLAARCATGILYDLRNAIIARLTVVRSSVLDGKPASEIVSRFNNEQEDFRALLETELPGALCKILEFVVISGYLLTLSWQLYLVCVAATPLMVFLAGKLGAAIGRLFRERYDEHEDISSTLYETVNNTLTVRSYCLQTAMRNRYQRSVHKLLLATFKQDVLRNYSLIIFALARTLPCIAFLIFAAWTAARGGINAADLVAFVIALDVLLYANENISQAIAVVRKSRPVIERALEPLTWAAEQERVVAADSPCDAPVLQFDAVSFAYQPDKPVLRGVSFTVARNETVALVGESGGGKSTALKLALGLYRPDSGAVRLNTAGDIAAVSHSGAAVVPQDIQLFSDSIAANIRAGKAAATMAEIRAAAQLAGADGFISALPCGYDAVVSEQGGNLSGGQKQRLMLARALVSDAALIVLDEPTSALDAENEELFANTLQSLQGKRTLLIVAHRLHTVRHADIIVLFDGGRIAECGTHDELLNINGKYAKLYRKMYSNAANAAGGKNVQANI